MSNSNQERAMSYMRMTTAGADDDVYTALVDFLIDAMHYCHLHGPSFRNALETARMHFDAETSGENILEDLNQQPNERNNP